MVRIGLLGAGRIGRMHGEHIADLKGAKLVAVGDFVEAAAREIADATGAEVQSVDAIIESGDIDAVLIATPTSTHADFVVKAARAGKAIFCEKPIDLDVGRSEKCLSIVAAAGVPLMVGFNRRFDPTFASMKARLVAGDVGAIELVSITSRDGAPPPRAYIDLSGGLFYDMAIHDFDMARFLMGEEFVEVQAFGSVLIDAAIGEAGDVDTATVMMRTESGRLCQISCSRRATYGRDQRIEVLGARGMLRAENVLQTSLEFAGPDGFTRDPVPGPGRTRFGAAFRAELEAFVGSLAQGITPTPSGEDGLRAQRLAEAATMACRTGRSVRL